MAYLACPDGYTLDSQGACVLIGSSSGSSSSTSSSSSGSSSNDWWTTLWNELANAVGWISTAIQANGCNLPGEYYDASIGQCVAVPSCPNGAVNTHTMPWSCYTPGDNEFNSNLVWILAIVGIVIILTVVLLVTRRK